MKSISKLLWGKQEKPYRLQDAVDSTNCTNCGAALQGAFCSHCGQKKEEKHDFTFWHFVGHSLHEFTHMDSRVYRTVKMLMFRPGAIAQEFVIGHRKKLINPVRLYIIVNVLYLLLGGVNTFYTPLEIHMQDRFQDIIVPLVNKKVAESHVSFEVYAKAFDHKTKEQAELALVLIVLAFSVVLSLLYYRQKRYYIEHLVLSLNIYSFQLVMLGIGFTLFYFVAQGANFGTQWVAYHSGIISRGTANANLKAFGQMIDNDLFMLVFFGVLTYVFVYIASRRFYGESALRTSVKTSFGLLGMYFIMFGYRLALFFITYYTLRVGE